jgi:hypothetical protein
MSDRAIRFTVADDTYRSATWKCWTHAGASKGSVYLTNREMRGAMHISFHESGKCHLKFDPDFVKAHAPPDSRFRSDQYIEMWDRPTKDLPGGAPLFHIFVPYSAVASERSADERKNLIAVPPPEEGFAVQVILFLDPASIDDDEWQRVVGASLHPIGTLPIQGEGTLRIVYRYCRPPSLPVGTGRPEMIRGDFDTLVKGKITRAIVRVPGTIPPALVEAVLEFRNTS